MATLASDLGLGRSPLVCVGGGGGAWSEAGVHGREHTTHSPPLSRVTMVPSGMFAVLLKVSTAPKAVTNVTLEVTVRQREGLRRRHEAVPGPQPQMQHVPINGYGVRRDTAVPGAPWRPCHRMFGGPGCGNQSPRWPGTTHLPTTHPAKATRTAQAAVQHQTCRSCLGTEA